MNIVNLESKWGEIADKGISIGTWTERATLCYLAELASKSENIIECGTYLGASAKVMLLANPDLRLVCIDTFECSGEPMMLKYLAERGALPHTDPSITTLEICRQLSLKREIDEGRCSLIVGDSSVAMAELATCGTEYMVDAIWVDDGHAEEDVLRDIRCLMPFLKSGGQIVGHDFDVDPFNDVARGVTSSGIKFDVPIPRMWRHFKQ